MLSATSLRGLGQAQQYQRIQDALKAGELTKAQAVKLSVELKLPEDMQAGLRTSKFVAVSYAEPGGKANTRKELPANNPLFLGVSAPQNDEYGRMAEALRAEGIQPPPRDYANAYLDGTSAHFHEPAPLKTVAAIARALAKAGVQVTPSAPYQVTEGPDVHRVEFAEVLKREYPLSAGQVAATIRDAGGEVTTHIFTRDGGTLALQRSAVETVG